MVIALDAATGRVLSKAYTVPSNNGGEDSILPCYYSGNAVWTSSPAVDPARGLLYVGTGTTTPFPRAPALRPGRPDALSRPQATTSTPSSRCGSATAQ